MEPADRLNLIFEHDRLQTFKEWPYNDKCNCNAAKMAEAGFFFIGTDAEPDAAQCFLCNKQLDGWEATDDPWAEHKKHSPECYFIELGKPEEMLTIQEFLDLMKNLHRNLIKQMENNFEKQVKEKYQQIKNMITEHR